MRNYTLSINGRLFIISLEGMSLTPYLDAARVPVKTTGVGATSADIPDLNSWPWTKTITVQQAIDMFQIHVKKYEAAVNKVLDRDVSQAQFDALVSITYNIGTGIVASRKGGMAGSTFMKLINTGASEQRIYNAIMQWDIPAAIIGRRTKEANLYVTGSYPKTMKANLFKVNPKTHKPIYGGQSIDLTPFLSHSKEQPATSALPKQNTGLPGDIASSNSGNVPKDKLLIDDIGIWWDKFKDFLIKNYDQGK